MAALSAASADAPTVRARRSALRALGGTNSPAAIAPVRAAFTNADPWIRFSAFQAADRLVKTLPSETVAGLRDDLAARRAAETAPFVRRAR